MVETHLKFYLLGDYVSQTHSGEDLQQSNENISEGTDQKSGPYIGE